MLKTFTATVVISGGWGYYGWIDEIPGAITDGRTIHSMQRRLREVAELMMGCYADEGKDYRSLERVDLDEPDEKEKKFKMDVQAEVPNVRTKNIIKTYIITVTKDNKWFIGHVDDIPGATGKERTLQKLRANLAKTARTLLSLNAPEGRETKIQEWNAIGKLQTGRKSTTEIIEVELP